MTITKEDIIDAGIEYTLANNPVCLGGAAFADAMREFNRNRSFEAGAEWVLSKLREIDEGKLDYLIEQECPKSSYFSSIDKDNWSDGFKIGYHKAVEG